MVDKDEELKKLYVKVQNVIKYAKIDKYLKDQEEIKKEGITFFGSFTGKNNLQLERMRNVKLKIELLESQKINFQKDITKQDLLSEIHACAISELCGEYNEDMKNIYKEIKDNSDEEINDEKVFELAYQKVTNGQSYLPVIHNENSKGIFGDIRVQTEFFKLENKKLENQIVLERGKSQFETFSLKKQNPEIIIPVSVKMAKI